MFLIYKVGHLPSKTVLLLQCSDALNTGKIPRAVKHEDLLPVCVCGIHTSVFIAVCL